MYIVETLKRTIGKATGMGRPSARKAKAAVQAGEPLEFRFADDGTVPNNPSLGFLVYKAAVRLDESTDPAAIFEELFQANGWGNSWRNGIYPYVHYHPAIHEVLGIARGEARVRFGGAEGIELDVAAGDVAVLPAGTGHQCLSASRDLLVVGAYPPEGEYDEYRGAAEERSRAKFTIPATAIPEQDPVFGRDGPLVRLWKR